MQARRKPDLDIPSSYPSYNGYQNQNIQRPQTFKEKSSTLFNKVHDYAHRADEKLSQLGSPIKPYLPTIGRLLVVITFLEDTYRILTDYSGQVFYICVQRGMNRVLTHIFFISNIVCMLLGSLLVISRKRLTLGVSCLTYVLISQSLAYGLIFDMQFFTRNLSLIGGLLLVLSESWAKTKKRVAIPGLLQLDSKDKTQTVTLIGRILLVFLFVAHVFRTKWTFGSILMNTLSAIGCFLVVIGYKARFSASCLAISLIIQNALTNTFWKYQNWNPMRDQLRYEYFQFQALVGGLILLVNIGAGGLSLDEKRKIY